MVSCPHGLGTVRTGVRPLMSMNRGERVTGAGAKTAPGPSAGAPICPAPFRDGTPASSLTAAHLRAGFLPPTDKPRVGVREAIAADQQLTTEQRQALLNVYESFVAAK